MTQIKKEKFRSFAEYYFWFYLFSLIPLLYSYKISEYFIKSSLIEDLICWLVNVVGLFGYRFDKFILHKWFWIFWLFWIIFYWSDLTWVSSFFIFDKKTLLTDLVYTVFPFLIFQLPIYMILAFYAISFNKNKYEMH